MTDEEKRIFEEWFEEKKENCEVYGNGDDFWVDDEIKKFCLMGFEQGLKTGRPQWHKVADELPTSDKDKYYFVVDKLNVYMIARFYEGKWSNYAVIEDVIAWCELPTFD